MKYFIYPSEAIKVQYKNEIWLSRQSTTIDKFVSQSGSNTRISRFFHHISEFKMIADKS